MWSTVLWSVALIYTIVPDFIVEARFVCNISAPVHQGLWGGCPKVRRNLKSTAVISGHGFTQCQERRIIDHIEELENVSCVKRKSKRRPRRGHDIESENMCEEQNTGKETGLLPYMRDSSYCNITCKGKQHIMCRYQAGGGSACHGYQGGLTQNEKDIILDMHNRLRQRVAKGQEHRGLKRQPPAANMMELTWDHELERIAQRWADQCTNMVSNDDCRKALDGSVVSQVVDWKFDYPWEDRSEAMIKQIHSWFDYVKNVDPDNMGLSAFSGQASYSSRLYGHFVWGATKSMGCGFSIKNHWNGKYTHKILCNYKPGIEVGKPVYIIGDPCSQCPEGSQCSHTWDGLCASLS